MTLRDVVTAMLHGACVDEWEQKVARTPGWQGTVHGLDAHHERADELLATPEGRVLAELVEAAEALRRQGHVITGSEARFFPDGRVAARLLAAVGALHALGDE